MSASLLPATADAPYTELKGKAWALLIVLCGAIFLDALDVSMMGVALPAIRDDLGMSTSGLQWVMSAYVLGYGGFLLLGGRAADLLGRRRMFLISLTVFVLFSGLGGLATGGELLIAARFVTGVSAAFTAPAGLSIIATSFAEGPARTKALSVFGATGASGFGFGLVVGGALTEVSWRWVFFVPVVMSALILAGARRMLPRTAPPPVDRRGFDIAGSIVGTAAMLVRTTAAERSIPSRSSGTATRRSIAVNAAKSTATAMKPPIVRVAPQPRSGASTSV